MARARAERQAAQRSRHLSALTADQIAEPGRVVDSAPHRRIDVAGGRTKIDTGDIGADHGRTLLLDAPYFAWIFAHEDIGNGRQRDGDLASRVDHQPSELLRAQAIIFPQLHEDLNLALPLAGTV